LPAPPSHQHAFVVDALDKHLEDVADAFGGLLEAYPVSELAESVRTSHAGGPARQVRHRGGRGALLRRVGKDTRIVDACIDQELLENRDVGTALPGEPAMRLVRSATSGSAVRTRAIRAR